IVVRRDTMEVIAGNHTLQAALYLGWTEIAAVVVDDDDATAKGFALADNRVGDLGGYDEDALASMIADVLDADEDLLDATSYSLEDLEALLGETTAPAPLEEGEGGEEQPEEDRPSRLANIERDDSPPRRATLSLFDRYVARPF